MFKSTRLLCLLFLSVFLTTACSKKANPRALSKEYAANLNRIAEAVEQVKDDESADKAAKVIASVREDMLVLSGKLEKMSEADRKIISENMTEDMKAAHARMTAAMQKLSTQPKYMMMLGQEMAKIGAAK
jgi:hypothetical protein